MPAESILRCTRKTRGLTLTEVARRVHVGVSRLYMIEAGARPATPDLADAIAREVGEERGSLFVPSSFTARQPEVSAL